MCNFSYVKGDTILEFQIFIVPTHLVIVVTIMVSIIMAPSVRSVLRPCGVTLMRSSKFNYEKKILRSHWGFEVIFVMV